MTSGPLESQTAALSDPQDTSGPSRRLAVSIGITVMAAAILIGLADVVRWIAPHITVGGTTAALQFQQAVRRPLLEFGFAAALIGTVCIVAVRSSHLGDQARLGILAVGVLVSGTLLGVGESRYSSAKNPTASFQSELERLHVPPSWQ